MPELPSANAVKIPGLMLTEKLSLHSVAIIIIGFRTEISPNFKRIKWLDPLI